MDAPLPSRFDFEAYRGWPDEQRWELLDGRPYAMSSPSPLHQTICLGLAARLLAALSGTPCQVFTSPLDVKLSEHDVVQPDVLVVCDKSQMTTTHVEGAPTLVIEVLSTSSLRHDRVRKFRLYAAAGVPEYWLVSPSPAMVEVHQWDRGGYRTHGVFTDQDTLSSAALPQLRLPLGDIFPAQDIDEVKESFPPYSDRD